MAKIKSRRTVDEWRVLIAEQLASGQTQEEWCIVNGVNLYTYRDRASRLRKMDNKGITGEAMFRQANLRKKNKRLCEATSKETGWIEVRQSTAPVSNVTETPVINTGRLIIEAGLIKMTANVEYPAVNIVFILKGLVGSC